MNEQQKDFHKRVADLLAYTRRLHEAAQAFAESLDIDTAAVFEGNDTTGGNASDTTIPDAVVAGPIQSDALGPDYVPQPVVAEYEEQDNAMDARENQNEQVRDTFDDLQAAADDVQDIVANIDLDELLNSVTLDEAMSH